MYIVHKTIQEFIYFSTWAKLQQKIRCVYEKTELLELLSLADLIEILIFYEI